MTTDDQKKAVTKAKIIKPSAASQALGAIFEEGLRDVVSYVTLSVVIPTAKQLLFDMISGGANRALFGDGGRASRRGYTSYSGGAKVIRLGELDAPGHPARTMSRRDRSAHNFSRVVIDTRDEADLVLDRLCENLESYGVVTVRDFYDLVGVTGNYTDDNFGWTDLSDARVLQQNGGFTLSLPRPKPVR